MINSSKPSSHVVRSLVDAFSTIGNKSRSKDHNAARCVLSQSIVNKSVDVFVTSECIHLYILSIVPRCLFWEISIM